MNLNGTQQNLLHQAFAWMETHMAGVVIGLFFWVIVLAFISCPAWLPLLIERFTR